MSTSLNVVSIAAVDCDCTRRSAMRARNRDMGTRCSGRLSVGAGMDVTEGWEGDGAVGEGEGLLFTCAATSSFVMRPSRPLPLIELISSASRFACAARLRAAGIMAVVDAMAGAGCALDGTGKAGAASAVAVEVVLAAVASVSMMAMISPPATVAPSPLMIFANNPVAGAGNSSTTLSVSISIRFSSRATRSPSFLCQETSVASATDSDNIGTLTSTGMAPILLVKFSRGTLLPPIPSAGNCALPDTPPRGMPRTHAMRSPKPGLAACAATGSAGCDAKLPGCPVLPGTRVYPRLVDSARFRPESHHAGTGTIAQCGGSLHRLFDAPGGK